MSLILLIQTKRTVATLCVLDSYFIHQITKKTKIPFSERTNIIKNCLFICEKYIFSLQIYFINKILLFFQRFPLENFHSAFILPYFCYFLTEHEFSFRWSFGDGIVNLYVCFEATRMKLKI